MLVRSGDLWHCANPACLSELAIGTTRDTEVDRVYCVCGAIMKKHYRPPGFHYLDFFGEREQDALQVLAPDLGRLPLVSRSTLAPAKESAKNLASNIASADRTALIDQALGIAAK